MSPFVKMMPFSSTRVFFSQFSLSTLTCKRLRSTMAALPTTYKYSHVFVALIETGARYTLPKKSRKAFSTFNNLGDLWLVGVKLERRQETQGAKMEGHDWWNALLHTKEGQRRYVIFQEVKTNTGWLKKKNTWKSEDAYSRVPSPPRQMMKSTQLEMSSRSEREMHYNDPSYLLHIKCDHREDDRVSYLLWKCKNFLQWSQSFHHLIWLGPPELSFQHKQSCFSPKTTHKNIHTPSGTNRIFWQKFCNSSKETSRVIFM